MNLYDLSVISLASGRVAFSIANDEIFRPVRNWVYLRSAPVDDNIVTYGDAGDDYIPARLAVRDTPFWSLRDEWHGDNDGLRRPGFVGKLISCPWCISFWISLVWVIAFGIFGHIITTLAVPFAAWSVATYYAKALS